jgi:putative spermidine/putrescine transport system permease protein
MLVYGLRTYIIAMCFLLMMPIAVLVIVSFSGDSYLTFPPRSVSLRWFALFLGDPSWQYALALSVGIGIVAAALSSIVGFVAAYALLRAEVRGKKLLLLIILSPVIIPHIITAIAIYFTAIQIQAVGSVVLLALCHAVMALPIVILILLSTLQAIEPTTEKAAIVLGCSQLQLFRRVVIPIAWPGVVSAALFAFLVSFDELLIALFLSGGKFRTLPVRVWQSLEMEVEPTIAAVSALLIGVTALVIILDWFLRHKSENPSSSIAH